VLDTREVHCVDTAVGASLQQWNPSSRCRVEARTACQGKGAASQCDDDLALEGDICQTTLNEDLVMQHGPQEELLCKDGKFPSREGMQGTQVVPNPRQ